MTELSTNLRRRREAAGISLQELERLSGVSRSAISTYENSTRKPKAEALAALARALHCRPVDLDPYFVWPDIASERSQVVREDVTPFGAVSVRRVPIYGLAMAQGVTDWHGDVVPDGEYQLDTIDVPDDGRRYAAFKVEGDSMEPRIHDGDIVLADLDLEPQPGNIVVAKWDDTVMVKRYRRYGRQVVLESLNPRYEPVQARPSWMLRVKRVMFEV